MRTKHVLILVFFKYRELCVTYIMYFLNLLIKMNKLIDELNLKNLFEKKKLLAKKIKKNKYMFIILFQRCI